MRLATAQTQAQAACMAALGRRACKYRSLLVRKTLPLGARPAECKHAMDDWRASRLAAPGCGELPANETETE